ncbi:MAG: O-antigen ligase family protein [Patescibacteria group bacterium]|nr:O-antigen ligase family protein [Patescibacteria group bacterium]
MSNKIAKICDYLGEISLLGIIFFTPVYFAFVQENYNVFELNKAVIFRILLTISLLAFAAKIFIKGTGHRRFPRKLFLLLALLGLSFLASTYFSIHPALSFWGSYGRQQGFYNFFHYWLFFILLALNLMRGWPRVKRAVEALVFSSIPVCFYGLLQYFNLDPLDWKEKVTYIGRIFSTLGQPNFFGQYLIIVIPLTVFSLIFLKRRFLSRFLLVILAVAQLTCLIFTYNRSAWLGLAAGAALFPVLILFAKKKEKIAWSLVGLGLFGVIAIACLNIFYFKGSVLLEPGEINIANRVESIFDFKSGSNKIRLYYWQASWEIFKKGGWQRKLFGYGPEVLPDIFVEYYRPEWGIFEKINTFPDRAHNAFFDTVLQFGLIGLLAFALFVGYILAAAFEYLRRPSLAKEFWLIIFILAALAGYFINSLLSFSLTVGYICFYFMLALLAVIVFSDSSSGRAEEERSRFFRPVSLALIWLAMFFLGVILVYYYNINAWRADYYYMKVKKAEAKKDCRQILDNMEKTVFLNPISTFYKERYIYHNLNCFEAVESEESRRDLYDNVMSMANSVGPREYGFYTWTHIAHAKSLFGYYIDPVYYGAAEEDYKRLIKTNPFVTTAYEDLGRMKLWQEDYEAAMANFSKAVGALPSLDSPYLNSEHRRELESEQARLFEMMGMAFAYKEDWDMAIDYYWQGLKLNPFYLRLYKKVADAYYSQGDIDRAIWYNKRGYMLNTEDYSWPLALSLLYKERGDMVEASKYIDEAASLNADSEFIMELKKEIEP